LVFCSSQDKRRQFGILTLVDPGAVSGIATVNTPSVIA
jgi:hypothetical protein